MHRASQSNGKTAHKIWPLLTSFKYLLHFLCTFLKKKFAEKVTGQRKKPRRQTIQLQEHVQLLLTPLASPSLRHPGYIIKSRIHSFPWASKQLLSSVSQIWAISGGSREVPREGEEAGKSQSPRGSGDPQSRACCSIPATPACGSSLPATRPVQLSPGPNMALPSKNSAWMERRAEAASPVRRLLASSLSCLLSAREGGESRGRQGGRGEPGRGRESPAETGTLAKTPINHSSSGIP